MYALPDQDLAGALDDVDQAVALAPTHISHYQLTLEPNTAFAANPPPLPDDDAAWTIQEACEVRLAEAGFGQYEVSAYARPGRRCAHNLNYWRFGDYLGIGAGAHGKINDARGVRRRWKTRLPAAYLAAAGQPARLGGDSYVDADDLPFEYMLNALRLIDGVPAADFAERTGLPAGAIATAREDCVARGWLVDDAALLKTTPLGQRFLNDVIEAFMA
jgi:oxygen-independent coproporphyrinogen-3 oxidase